MSPSARKGGGSKDRAAQVGNAVISQYAPIEIVQYFITEQDRQHIQDATTMIVDYKDYAFMPEIGAVYGKKKVTRASKSKKKSEESPIEDEARGEDKARDDARDDDT
jgi:hypothetical protein